MQAAPPVPPAAALTATPLTSLGAGVRWGTLGLGLVLAAISGQTTLVVAAWALALAAIALWQSEEGNGSDQPPRLTGATEVAVEYGADATYGRWATAQPLPDGRYRFVLLDLEAGTTYHFRVVATGPGGTTATEDATLPAGTAADPAPEGT